MDDREIRLRLIEAAAKAPNAHPKGFAEGVLEMAQSWGRYVRDDLNALEKMGKPLGLPKKG
jgi:hypothetical protein